MIVLKSDLNFDTLVLGGEVKDPLISTLVEVVHDHRLCPGPRSQFVRPALPITLAPPHGVFPSLRCFMHVFTLRKFTEEGL